MATGAEGAGIAGIVVIVHGRRIEFDAQAPIACRPRGTFRGTALWIISIAASAVGVMTCGIRAGSAYDA
jgi:hypothetical protein